MMWMIVLVVVVWFLLMHCHGIFTAIWIYLGPRVFTRRQDGTFSRWQIAGQILVVGGPALVCLGVIVSWLMGIIRSAQQG